MLKRFIHYYGSHKKMLALDMLATLLVADRKALAQADTLLVLLNRVLL